MKKAASVLLIAILFFGCSTDNSILDNSSTNVEYFFEIELGDQVHKIKGNTPEIGVSESSNTCGALFSQGYLSLQFTLNDITGSDYISGQYLTIYLSVENPNLGPNIGTLSFLPTPYLNNLADQKEISFLGDNFVENTPMNVIDAIEDGKVGKITNIKLTDLGTASSGGLSYDGKTVKGSYEGVLYYIKNGWTDGDTNHDIPIPIKISFSAVRIN